MVDNDSLYKRPACLVGFNIKRTYICPLVPTYTYIPKHFAATIYLPLPKFYVLSSVLLCTVVKFPSHSHVQILDGKMCNRRCCCCCENVYGCVCTYIHCLRMQPNVRLDIGKNRCIININIGSSSSGSDSNTNNINKNNCCMHKMRGGRVRERTSCTVSACAAASASMHESP